MVHVLDDKCDENISEDDDSKNGEVDLEVTYLEKSGQRSARKTGHKPPYIVGTQVSLFRHPDAYAPYFL